MGSGVEGLGLRVWGLGLRVWGVGFRLEGCGCLGFKVWWVRVSHKLGIRVYHYGF